MELIPTFEVGQRVIYHQRPYEFMCPLCRHMANSMQIQENIVTTILRKASTNVYCEKCQGSFPIPEGFYAITLKTKSGRYTAVPYTLIEAIKEEPC